MTRAAAALTVLAALLAVSPMARAADPTPASAPIPIELNKLELLPAAANAPAGCRVYFVINNNEPETLSQLRLDLILFGTDGVIARRVALDLGPLPAKKTGVRLFDLTGQACEGIGRVLVNDVLACQSARRPRAVPRSRRRADRPRASTGSRPRHASRRWRSASSRPR